MISVIWLLCAASVGAIAGMVWSGLHRGPGAHRISPAPAGDSFAEWCRHISLTVVTHTGAVFSTTLPELAASEASTFRNWNVPIQVTLWSDLDDEAVCQVPKSTADDCG